MSTFLPRKRPIRTGLAEKNSTVSLFTHELRMLGFVFFRAVPDVTIYASHRQYFQHQTSNIVSLF